MQHGPQIGLTPDLEDAIVSAVEAGKPLETAAKIAGISARTLQSWAAAGRTGTWPDGHPVATDTMEIVARFADRLATARAKFEAKLVETLVEASETVGRDGRRDWRAILELAKNHPDLRTRWHEHREIKVDHHGTVGHEHRMVRQLPDADLIELASPDLAGLLEPPAHIDNVD